MKQALGFLEKKKYFDVFCWMFVVFNQKKPKNIDTSPEMKSQKKWIRELFCFCFTKGINFDLKFMGGKNFPNAPMNWFAKRTTAITIIITLLHTQHEVVGNRSSYQATTYYNLQPQYNMYKHMYVYMYIYVYKNWVNLTTTIHNLKTTHQLYNLPTLPSAQVLELGGGVCSLFLHTRNHSLDP